MDGGTASGQNRSGQTPDEEHNGEHETFPELCADLSPGRQLAPAAADGPRGFYGIAEQDKERTLHRQFPSFRVISHSSGQILPTLPIWHTPGDARCLLEGDDLAN